MAASVQNVIPVRAAGQPTRLAAAVNWSGNGDVGPIS
jgi:hypothetical protein